MERQTLIQRIADTALLRGQFKLRSGRTSNYYLDKYLFSTQPDILAALGQLFAQHVTPDITLLAGAELGGIPLVSAASMAADLPCLFVRNQKKDYGTVQQLEGKLSADDRVLLVEDVCTSGGQVLEAAAVIEAQGARIIKIVATIDREEGARKNIEQAGYVFESLFTKSDLGV
ncbi:MAG: orotate phosphoribosyltransferase [Planctomycetaceae bacterium]|nr:orotate phosphoribosyltransferase [Planctomycetaceae bacterium]